MALAASQKAKEKFDLKIKVEQELAKPVDQISIIFLVDAIIKYAYVMRSSDIHIDPEENDVKVRFRIDGVMHTMFQVVKELNEEIIARIKVLSGLRTDEHQAAQDGRFKFFFEEDGDRKNFDIRVSITPTYYGENTVMRLLVEKGESYSLENIGLGARDLAIVKEAIEKPYGMILVTGPTGSGKTTTLYTVLRILNTDEVSIITIEDPIEYSLKGITQIQVNTQSGINFAMGLRSILRQDPDIIMVGEIRDEETASISVNAALTGHLLLSTLHTNDAPTALPRLLDMKIEPFLISSTVNIVIGQRLVRKICAYCKDEKKLTISDVEAFATIIPAELLEKTKDSVFYYGKGCDQCGGSGYWGRIGIYEVLQVSDAIREAIMKRLNSAEVAKIASHEGMTTMLEDGFNKALNGITTVEEVLRVIHE